MTDTFIAPAGAVFTITIAEEYANPIQIGTHTKSAKEWAALADGFAEAVRAKEAFKDDSVKLQHELDVLNASIAERNKSDPLWRLHNLADAMSEDAKDSPYSQESWDLQEAAYREKCGELKRLMVYAELSAKRDAVMELYGLRYSAEPPSGDPAAPYYIRVHLPDRGISSCHGATPKEAADRAISWLESRGAKIDVPCFIPADKARDATMVKPPGAFEEFGVGGDLQAESIERCLKCGVRFLTTEHEEPMCAQHSVSPPSQGK